MSNASPLARFNLNNTDGHQSDGIFESLYAGDVCWAQQGNNQIENDAAIKTSSSDKAEKQNSGWTILSMRLHARQKLHIFSH